MGGPTFVNEKVVHKLEKNNVVPNFERKAKQTITIAFKLILTNIEYEIIDKSTIISTRRWTSSLRTAHSKMGGPTFVNEKVVQKPEKKDVVLNFETEVRQTITKSIGI